MLPEIGPAPEGTRIDLLTLQRVGLPAEQTKGAQLAATSAGVTDYNWFGSPGLNPPAEVAALQSAASAGSDGIAVAVFPVDLFARPIEEVAADDIPIVTVDVPAPGTEAKTHFGPSRFATGAALAREWSDKLGPNAEGYIQPGVCVPGVPVLDAVVAGFKSEMTKLQPGVETRDAANVTPDPGTNFTSWQQLISQESDALGFFGVCDQDAPNLVKVKQSSGGKYLIGTTSGDTADTIQAVETGVLDTVISQSGFVQGYVSTYYLLQKIVNKKDIPEGWFNTGVEVITKDNAGAALDHLNADDPKVSFAYYQTVIDNLISGSPSGPVDDSLTSDDPGPSPSP